jgi:hypothetical protein
MTESSAIPGFAEQQNAATAFIGNVLNSGADPMLKAHADVLETVGTAMTDWLQRRQEAVVDAQRLIAQLQAVSGPGDMLKTQQEWMGGAFQRMNADAIAYQASAMQLVEKSRHWVGQSVETTNGTTQAQANLRTAGARLVPAAAKSQ